MIDIFSCAATQEVPVPVRLSVPDFEFRDKIVFTKPLPRQIYCWQCCGLVCLSVLHVVVWNLPLIGPGVLACATRGGVS